MVQDEGEQTRAVTIVEPTALPALTTGKELLLAVVAGVRPQGGVNALAIRADARGDVLSMVYQNPGLAELGIDLAPTLRVIRETFPRITAAFDDAALEGILPDFPVVKALVDDQRTQLGDAVQEAGIKTMEMVLRALIMEANSGAFSTEGYYSLLSHHALFVELSRNLNRRNLGHGSKLDERQKFIDLGQALLKRKKMFEIDPEKVTDERHESHDQDYTGRLAQLRVLAVMAGSVDGEDVREVVVRDYRDMFEDTILKFPDKIADLRAKFGDAAVVDFGSASHWTVAPGGPDFSRAEETSFLHGGNS